MREEKHPVQLQDIYKTEMVKMESSLGSTEIQLLEFANLQTYTLKDFLQTNSTLNESINILKEQSTLLRKKFTVAEENKKEDVLREAAYEIRQNAHALAAMVQAKVTFMRAIKK